MAWAPLLGLVFSTSAKADFKGSLNVEIDGLRNNVGQVCITLFGSSKGFPDNGKQALEDKCFKITEIPLVIKFDGLKAGSYAVVLLHDENGTKTMEMDSLGMPREGFGFSQNPEITNRAPKFSESAFFIAGPQTDVKINMKYLSGF
ncbi:hypothetical protein NIES4071_78210 [Calothrix sp. NIES-4071]|nr:hypothetical protein NIES4071_78210 [Calothrix sp. NIES-4071]BAZ62093.1 hypothetical protein NIES4105_78140 [Calothrix sp. NIES-4105]